MVFKQDVEIQGKLYVDKDQAGSITIVAGSTTASVVFGSPYNSIPKIVANLNYSATSSQFARYGRDLSAVREPGVLGRYAV